MWQSFERAVVGAGLAVFISRPASAQAPRTAVLAQFPLVIAGDSLAIDAADLSPDGQWLVFSVDDGAGQAKLWMGNTQSGTVRPVGGDALLGRIPAWFPSGDRIAFLASDAAGVLTLSIDRHTGLPTGSPKPITTDRADAFEIAPDGHSIAYQVRLNFTHSILKVIADTGGASSTIAHLDKLATPPSFSADGRDLYYDLADEPAGGHAIYRVPTTGGAPIRAYGPFPRGRVVGRRLDARHDLVVEQRPAADGLLVLSLANDTLMRIDGVGASNARTPSLVANTLLVLQHHGAAQMIAVPTNGGPVLPIGSGRSREIPLAWPAATDHPFYLEQYDSARRVIAGSLNGHRQTISINVDAIQTEQSAPRAFWGASADARYWLIRATPRQVAIRFQFDQPNVKLFLYDVEHASATELTNTFASMFIATASPASGLPYAQHVGDSVQVRLVSPPGRSEVLRSFPHAVARNAVFAVRNHAIAWTEMVRDTTLILIGENSSVAPRLVARVPGSVSELAWAPGGEWLAAIVSSRDSGEATTRVIFRRAMVKPSEAESRDVVVQSGRLLQWLPNSRSVLVHETFNGGSSNDIREIPLDAAEHSRVVTAITGAFAEYLLSPDGRFVVVGLERPGGTRLFRVDLANHFRTPE